LKAIPFLTCALNTKKKPLKSNSQEMQLFVQMQVLVQNIKVIDLPQPYKVTDVLLCVTDSKHRC